MSKQNIRNAEPAHFESSAANVSCVLGSGVTLSCSARGDAPLAVHWTHRGAPLDLDSYRCGGRPGEAGGGARVVRG